MCKEGLISISGLASMMVLLWRQLCYTPLCWEKHIFGYPTVYKFVLFYVTLVDVGNNNAYCVLYSTIMKRLSSTGQYNINMTEEYEWPFSCTRDLTILKLLLINFVVLIFFSHKCLKTNWVAQMWQVGESCDIYPASLHKFQFAYWFSLMGEVSTPLNLRKNSVHSC